MRFNKKTKPKHHPVLENTSEFVTPSCKSINSSTSLYRMQLPFVPLMAKARAAQCSSSIFPYYALDFAGMAYVLGKACKVISCGEKKQISSNAVGKKEK